MPKGTRLSDKGKPKLFIIVVLYNITNHTIRSALFRIYSLCNDFVLHKIHCLGPFLQRVLHCLSVIYLYYVCINKYSLKRISPVWLLQHRLRLFCDQAAVCDIWKVIITILVITLFLQR